MSDFDPTMIKGDTSNCVYVYRCPQTRVVKYVGSGGITRMHQHTQLNHINHSDSPFYQWLREQGDIDWSENREMVAGPFDTKEQAELVEQAWIDTHSDTVLNVNRADNGQPINGHWTPHKALYHVGSGSRMVVCSDGRQWTSITPAAADLGVGLKTMKRWLRLDGPIKFGPRRGLQFMK